MKLTACLRNPIHWNEMRSASWQRWRKRKIVDSPVLTKLEAEGVEIVDANEFVKKIVPAQIDWTNLPNSKPLFPSIPPEDFTNPNWHDERCRVFTRETFAMDGLKQGLAFAKAVEVKQGLPDQILEVANSLKIDKDVDELAQRVVQQAFLWDATLDKQHRLRDKVYPTWRWPVKFGPLPSRSNELLVRGFLRLCESHFYPMAALTDRMMGQEQEFRVNLTRQGSKVQFKLAPVMTILSKTPSTANPFGDANVVSETEAMPESDISPLLSTANIDPINLYEDSDHFAFDSASSFRHIHTACFSHHIPGSHTHIRPRWNDDRFNGTTAMYSFATALLNAKILTGGFNSQMPWSVLPKPITVQIIHLTGKEFQFAVFQLNTLDLENESSKVKNIIWLTDKIPLFNVCQNHHGTETFDGYNPEVFKLFVAMYASGIET